MNVKLSLGKRLLQKKCGEGNVILCNENFLNLGYANSKFQGFFIQKELQFFKIIEEILVPGEITEIHYNGSKIERTKGDFTETFSINGNSLFYDLSEEKEVTLVLDVRDVSEFSNNRLYSINYEDGKTIIESQGIFIIINKVLGKYEQWVEYEYTYDQKRNSSPVRWPVFQAVRGVCNGCIITAGFDKESAIEENNTIQKEEKEFKAENSPQMFAYQFAANSLGSLINRFGLYAGLPWFFQNWTRDEMISLKGLSYINERKAKEIIIARSSYIEKGKLPNRFPSSELGSADSIGWYFLRAHELFSSFTASEKKIIESKLREAVEYILEKDFDGLVKNGKHETWMDTGEDDFREGYRIEIQCLFLRMVTFLGEITEEKKYFQVKNELKRKIKQYFFHEYLYDGKDDPTIRPNVFLAYYINPQLLTRKEWEVCFDIVMKKLWLDWGGVSTIQKDSPLFCPEYTGENNKSYHRGDSWYWVNNITAICLHKVNKVKFASYIKLIVNASTKDILWQGAFGSASEVSSASEQTASGCMNQAWSNATYLELIKTLN